MAIKAKTNRFVIPLGPQDWNVIETAASIKRVSISSYILSAALNAARRELGLQETITLDDEGRDRLLSLLESPPEPTDALRKLLQRP